MDQPYNFKNLIINFPGGCGGNHMSNMISLNPRFTPRFIAKKNYVQEMLHNYREMPYKEMINKTLYAHFFETFGLDSLRNPLLKNKILTNKTINIHSGHWFHFYANKENDIEEITKELTDVKWIVVKWPKPDTIQHKRIAKLEMPTAEPKFYTWPFQTLCANPHFQEANDSNGFFFDSDLLFAKDGSYNLRQILKEKLQIDLHPAADELHEIWYTWVNHLVYDR